MIGSGSVALANRIRTVGDTGLRMLGTAQQGAPIYRDNAISDVNRAGAGSPGVEGGRATGGNACSDGSCSVRGARRLYLTRTTFNGAQAANACESGFHMGSLWEIWDPTALEYDRYRGFDAIDAGHGPPQIVAWVRTGGTFGGSSTVPGLANCLGWISSLATEEGTFVVSHFNWSSPPTSNVQPWDAGSVVCNSSLRVWCVGD